MTSNSDSSRKITSDAVLQASKDALATNFRRGCFFTNTGSILAKFRFLAPKAPLELKNSAPDAEFHGEPEKKTLSTLSKTIPVVAKKTIARKFGAKASFEAWSTAFYLKFREESDSHHPRAPK